MRMPDEYLTRAVAKGNPTMKIALQVRPYAALVQATRTSLPDDTFGALIGPTPGFHFPTQGFQHPKRGGWVTLGDKHMCLAEREFILLGQLSGCVYLALLNQGQDLDGGNRRQPPGEVPLACRLLRLRQHCCCPTYIARWPKPKSAQSLDPLWVSQKGGALTTSAMGMGVAGADGRTC